MFPELLTGNNQGDPQNLEGGLHWAQFKILEEPLVSRPPKTVIQHLHVGGTLEC